MIPAHIKRTLGEKSSYPFSLSAGKIKALKAQISVFGVKWPFPMARKNSQQA